MGRKQYKFKQTNTFYSFIDYFLRILLTIVQLNRHLSSFLKKTTTVDPDQLDSGEANLNRIHNVFNFNLKYMLTTGMLQFSQTHEDIFSRVEALIIRGGILINND